MEIITSRQAALLIEDGKTLAANGFLIAACPEEILKKLEERFVETGSPKDLTLVAVTSVGDIDGRGMDHLAHEKLVKRYIAGHYNLVPRIQRLVLENKIEGYNFPQGIMGQLMRDTGAGKAGVASKIGLDTFVDPRQSGGKLNSVTTEELCSLVELRGEKHILYHALPLDYALIRGTCADRFGNISMEDEAATADALALAMNAKNSGGKVIAQVKRIAERISPHDVRVPSVLVDYVCVCENPKNHMQSALCDQNPAYTAPAAADAEIPPVDAGERRVIAKRAYLELEPLSVINLGIGIPEGIASIAGEEGRSDFTMTVEAGQVGGLPAGGRDFGCTANPHAILYQNQMFDFYHGGGIDQTFLGLAEVDGAGNINVSKFGPRIAGCGGFICITQSTPKIYFTGTFTAKGLKTEFRDGKLNILREGEVKKFKKSIEQITFSAENAVRAGRKVMYITERCVFELNEKGLVLTEIAPGIDIERDILPNMEFAPIIADDIKIMDPWVFE